MVCREVRRMVNRTKSEPEYCEHCNHITKAGKTAWYCDICDTEITWNVNVGFVHKIKLWHGDEDCNCGDAFPEWQFCSQDCLLEWSSKASDGELSKHNLESKYSTIQFTLHPKNLPNLLHSLQGSANDE